jgi:hypothetical protein
MTVFEILPILVADTRSVPTNSHWKKRMINRQYDECGSSAVIQFVASVT